MDDLEKLREEFLNFYSRKFEIFYLEEPIIYMDERYVIWKGNDFKQFLSLAEKLGVKLIYFSTVIGEKDSEYSGKIGLIELSFLYNNIFHVFISMASWFKELLEKEEAEPKEEGLKMGVSEEREEVSRDVLERSVEELVSEMIDFIKEEYKGDLSEIIGYLRDVQRQFWLEKGIRNLWILEPSLKIKLEKVENRVERYFLEQMRKKEKEILPRLVEECISWCKENKLTKLAKTNLKYFLAERNINLTPIGREELYSKVNLRLKVK